MRHVLAGVFRNTLQEEEEDQEERAGVGGGGGGRGGGRGFQDSSKIAEEASKRALGGPREPQGGA
eukprot:2367442-Pyramimonas_sp.AAC.1